MVCHVVHTRIYIWVIPSRMYNVRFEIMLYDIPTICRLKVAYRYPYIGYLCANIWPPPQPNQRHTRTLARSHARTRARTRARTHARTHTCAHTLNLQ